jgi:hypothetical protein
VKEGEALTLLLFIFAQNFVRNVLENQVGINANGTHQPLVYIDDVNLLGDNIDKLI